MKEALDEVDEKTNKAIEEEADDKDEQDDAPTASSELQLDYDPERAKNFEKYGPPSTGKVLAKATTDVASPVLTTLAVGIVPCVLLGLAFPPAFFLAFFISFLYGMIGVFACALMTGGKTGRYGFGHCLRDVIGFPFTAVRLLAKGTWRLVKGLGRLGYKGIKKVTKAIRTTDKDKVEQ